MRPEAYWIDADDYLRLNAIPAETYSAEMRYDQYTDFDGLADEDEHPLFSEAGDLLENLVVHRMGPITRNPRLAQEAKAMIPDLLHAFVQSDLCNREENTSTSFGFGYDYDLEEELENSRS